MSLAIITVIITQIAGFIFVAAYEMTGLMWMVALDVFMFAVCYYEIELKPSNQDSTNKKGGE